MDPTMIDRMKLGIPNPSRMVTEYTDKSFLFFKHEALMNEIEKKRSGTKRPLPGWDAAQMTSHGYQSSVPVQLTPANCVDIQTLAQNTDKVLDGKYFLCRTLAPPLKMSTMTWLTVVEDPRGQQGVRLALYTLLPDLPVSQILVIKNPWFKSTQDGGFALRCDNPAEVFVMSDSACQKLFPGIQWEGNIPIMWQEFIESQPQSAIEWKNEGNKSFVARKYTKAIQFYTEGLNFEDSVSARVEVKVTCDMLSNRAAAYLHLGCCQNALNDVNKLLEIDPNHIKGLYRKGKSLLELQRVEEAIQFLKLVRNLENLDSENQKLFTELLKLAEIMFKQQKTGKYDVLKLYNEAAIRHDDCADFVGPVKVEKIEGKGRGLVATEDIEPGQLISATKAFVVIFPDHQGQGDEDEVESSLNLTTDSISTSSHRKLVQEIAQKLALESSLCHEIYQLYAGTEMPIYNLAGNEDHVVDMKRIDAICNFNAFSGCMLMTNVNKQHEFMTEVNAPIEASGLWVFPSFFNHSCWDCNALWTAYGDMFFVRAFKKILKGEEILIPYMVPIQLCENREEFIKKRGFVCECRLCQVDRDESAEGRKRAKLIEKFDKYWNNDVGRNPDGEKILMICYKNISDLDKGGRNPNLKIFPSLSYAMVELAQYYFFNPKNRNLRKTIELLTQCYGLTLNSPLKELAVECCVELIGAHLTVGNVGEGKKWVETLKKEVLIFHGTLDMAKVTARDTVILMQKYKISF